MPNGHLVHPVWDWSLISDATSRVAGIMRVFNTATFFPVFIWVAIGIAVVAGVVWLLAKLS